jgi:hypothetical protein
LEHHGLLCCCSLAILIPLTLLRTPSFPAQSAAGIMAEALDTLKRRVQVAELAQAFESYVARQAEDVDVDVYLRDAEGAFLYHFITHPASLVPGTETPELEMELVAEMADEVLEPVTHGFEEGKMVEIQAGGVRTGAYVPVHEEGTPGKAGVLALVKMQSKSGKELTASKLSLVKRLLPAMATSIRKATRKAPAWQPAEAGGSLLGRVGPPALPFCCLAA